MISQDPLEAGRVTRRSVVRGMGLAGVATVFGGSLVRSVLRAGSDSVDVATLLSGASTVAAEGASPLASTEPLGVWDAPFTPDFAVNGIHAVLLHTGKVLLIESTGAYLWDPVSGAGQRVNPPNDIFCAGHTVLGNGEVLVVGGRLLKAGMGPRYVSTFEPSTATWTRRADMRQGRWYPTATLLSDGRAVITAGKNQTGGLNTDVEVYDNGAISLLSSRQLPFYPNQFLLPSGKVLVMARSAAVFSLDPASGAAAKLPKMRGKHAAGPAVLLPGGPNGSSTVMICGGKSGSAPASREVESFDASNPAAGWALRAALPGPRVQMNLVILPDGRVLAVGGTDGSVGQRQSLLYDPAGDTWAPMASQIEERGYHSTAVLLPDGRVLSAATTRHREAAPAWSCTPRPTCSREPGRPSSRHRPRPFGARASRSPRPAPWPGRCSSGPALPPIPSAWTSATSSWRSSPPRTGSSSAPRPHHRSPRPVTTCSSCSIRRAHRRWRTGSA